MIKFIEKKPWTDHSPFTGQTYAPNYMVKDGVEYFMVNRVVSSEDMGYANYHLEESGNVRERAYVLRPGKTV